VAEARRGFFDGWYGMVWQAFRRPERRGRCTSDPSVRCVMRSGETDEIGDSTRLLSEFGRWR